MPVAQQYLVVEIPRNPEAGDVLQVLGVTTTPEDAMSQARRNDRSDVVVIESSPMVARSERKYRAWFAKLHNRRTGFEPTRITAP